MTTIKIPDEDRLIEELNGIGSLLVAREWHRAAVVYAFTGIGGPRNSAQPDWPRRTILEFTRLGIKGLTTPKSVRRYRRAWELAIENGWAPPVDAGDTVDLPEEPFPEWTATMPEYIAPAVEDEFEPTPRMGHSLLTELDLMRKRIERCVVIVQRTPGLSLDQRTDALEYLDEVDAASRNLRLAIQGVDVSTPAGDNSRWETW